MVGRIVDMYGNNFRQETTPYYQSIYGSGPRPPAGDIEIDSDGVNFFGAQPNVVLYLDFTRKVLGSQISLTDGRLPWETGTLTTSNPTPLPIIRELVPGGGEYGWATHEVGDTSQRNFKSRYAPHRAHRQIFSFGIPKDRLFPGDNADVPGLEPANLPSDSGSKDAWDLYDDTANNNADDYDATFQHGGGPGNFFVSGNSTSSPGPITTNGASFVEFCQVADGETGAWNVIDLLKTCGANSVTDATLQRLRWSNNLINVHKTAKTHTFNFMVPFANNVGAGTVVNGGKDTISLTNWAALCRRNTTSAYMVCKLFGFHYRAIQSIVGVSDDYKQCLFATSHSTIAGSPRVMPIICDTWTNTKVTVSGEKIPSWANYVIVENASGFETPEAVVRG